MEKDSKLLKMSEISLWLDTYDDIFSDFDPRPYHQRALSIDFLDEAKRASRDKEAGIELKLLIAKKKRNATNEILIKKRLREHFRKHHAYLHREKMGIIRKGIEYTVIGLLVMFLATLLTFEYEKTLLTAFLIVIMEPAGWFLFWEGMNQAVFESKRINPDLEFYEKMIKCRVEFVSY
ncbi:MAG: hypothetical protein NT120_04890 [Candidatus Aenigmarchaeota archaeon]|nr:hypothetical protein [Candidatus Aenigmarchaeota archaeon]